MLFDGGIIFETCGLGLYSNSPKGTSIPSFRMTGTFLTPLKPGVSQRITLSVLKEKICNISTLQENL